MTQKAACSDRAQGAPHEIAIHIQEAFEGGGFRFGDLRVLQAQPHQCQGLSRGETTQQHLGGGESVFEGTGEVVAKGRLPDILIQAQHHMHAFHFSQIQQQRGNLQPSVRIAVKGVQVIDQHHDRAPGGQQSQEALAAFRIAGSQLLQHRGTGGFPLGA